MSTDSRTSKILVVFLILIGAALRIARHFGYLPLPPNVAPVGAMALFGGAYLGRRSGWAVPIGLMLISDAVIGFDTPLVTVSIYGSFLASVGLGRWWGRRLAPAGTERGGRVLPLVGTSLLGSTIFYLVTNAAVWASWSMYPKTAAGLLQSYVAGLPFFRNTLIGDLGYVSLFFGLYALVVLYSKRQIPAPKRASLHE